MNPAGRFSLASVAVGLLMCGGGAAQTATGASTDTLGDCGEFQASRYEILFRAHAFSPMQPFGEDNEIFPEVRALRCLTREPDAAEQMRYLLADGTMAGRLFALVGLRILSPEEFQREVEPYTSSEDKVRALGGCIVTDLPVSRLAMAIQAGSYSESYLPHLKDPNPPAQWGFEINHPQDLKDAPDTGR